MTGQHLTDVSVVADAGAWSPRPASEPSRPQGCRSSSVPASLHSPGHRRGASRAPRPCRPPGRNAQTRSAWREAETNARNSLSSSSVSNAGLARDGQEIGPLEHPAGPDGPHTAFVSDPDRYRIELVQWPPGHPDGITEADFPAGPHEPSVEATQQPIRLYMSMSLDGYIAGPGDRSGQELGAGRGPLFNWLDGRLAPGVNGQVCSELMATGAVMSGRRTFELARRWAATTTTAYRSTCSPTTPRTATSRRATRHSTLTSPHGPPPPGSPPGDAP